MAVPKLSSGATLLELLVVLTIMMTLLGLIGGNAVDSVDRASAQAEVISVYSLIKKSSVRSFASGNIVVLLFSGTGVVVNIGGLDESKKTYQHLRFDEQSVRFSRNGMIDTFNLSVHVRGVERILDFNSIFHGKFAASMHLGDGFEE